MERREFLGASLVAAAALGLGSQTDAGSAQERKKDAMREYYELRQVHFAGAQAQERYGNYLKTALLPALARAGAGPVGVFTQAADSPDLILFLLVPYASLESYLAIETRLEKDAEYSKAGAEALNLPSTDPPYTRVESWLLHAFEGFPKLHVPAEVAAGKGRQFELRTYESHSEKAGAKKIEMFNAGEIGIFERAGFQPVFFAKTIIGSGMPNLTYMVTYPEGTERSAFWAKFSADPEKVRLFAIPEYQDKLVVSKIRSVMLHPTSYSRI